jgi:hypothetical protein
MDPRLKRFGSHVAYVTPGYHPPDLRGAGQPTRLWKSVQRGSFGQAICSISSAMDVQVFKAKTSYSDISFHNKRKNLLLMLDMVLNITDTFEGAHHFIYKGG